MDNSEKGLAAVNSVTSEHLATPEGWHLRQLIKDELLEGLGGFHDSIEMRFRTIPNRRGEGRRRTQCGSLFAGLEPLMRTTRVAAMDT